MHRVRALVVAAVVVVAVAAGVVLGLKLGVPLAAINDPGADHWAPGHRQLTVSDRTGDAAWHAAISQGVATWVAAGSALRLTLVTQTGPCHQDLDTIEICERVQSQISKAEIPGEQGFVTPQTTHGNQFHSVTIVVCSDCAVDQPRRVVITTHELGHALGLPHNQDEFSVMYPLGGTFGPDPHDLALLRSKDGAAHS